MNPCQVIHSIANSYFQGWGIKKGISPAPFFIIFLGWWSPRVFN